MQMGVAVVVMKNGPTHIRGVLPMFREVRCQPNVINFIVRFPVLYHHEPQPSSLGNERF